jgi:hypothetical protein
MTQFLKTMNNGGIEAIQAITVSKLIGIANTTQFIRCNDIDSVKDGEGRSHPWYVTTRGAMEMLLKRNFGGNVHAKNVFHAMDGLPDADRVEAALSILAKANPEALLVKPRGRPKVKPEPIAA